MPPVQPTPEYDLAVVPYRPYHYWLRVVLVAVLGILLALGGYFSGYYYGTSTEQAAILERDRLRISSVEAKAEIKRLEQSIANLTLGSKVDRKATEQVRAQVVELKNRIAELERDNTFYRDLMRPDNDDKGISMAPPTIALLADVGPNIYDYKMVVKQLAANRLQVVGYLELILVGKDKDGKPQRFALHQVSQAKLPKRIKLNFRYFQRIEGRMELPDTFKPDRIELKIISLKPKKALIEKRFNWIIKEG